MKRFLLSCLTIVICLGFMQAAAPESDSGKPQYTSDNQLLPPKNFREWIFLSSGLGMSYTPGSADHVMFTNVFVPQWAYAEFVQEREVAGQNRVRGGGARFRNQGLDQQSRTLSNRSHGIRRGSEGRNPLSGQVGLLQLRRKLEISRRPIPKPPAGSVMRTTPPSNILLCSSIPR